MISPSMSSETTPVKSSSSFNEEDQQIASNALNLFKVGQYESSLGIIKKLQKAHPSDPHIMHNRFLNEFLKSGKTKVQEFRKNMLRVQRQLHQSNKDDEDGVPLNNEKINHAALCYNQALLLHKIHQYNETEALLERLTENMDSPDDSLLLKIYLLLVDTYLRTYKTDKANLYISMIEKHFLGQNEAKSSYDDKAHSITAAELESIKIYLGYQKNICCLQSKSLKAFKKDMKFTSNLSSSSSGATRSSILSVATVFLKSHFEYTKCNFHKAYRILGGSSPPSANQAAANGGHDCVSSMFYNNLALIHFSLGKYSVGAFYMQKALHENEIAMQAATKQHYVSLSTIGGRHQQQFPVGKPLSVLTINRRLELLYNCGLHFLFAGNATSAFDCLVVAVQGFRRNPRLWLRLAECCIQKSTLLPAAESNSKNKKVHHQNHSPFSIIGSGNHQKVVVNYPFHANGGKSNNTVLPSPTLEFASICLKNALTLLTLAINEANDKNQIEVETSENHDMKASVKFRPSASCLPGAPVTGSQFDHLYSSVLINSSFVALCLGDNLIALEYSQKVLSLPAVSGCHRYLARMYSAEALVSLDRISEAIDFLSIDKVTSISTETDENGKNSSVSDESKHRTNSSAVHHNHAHTRSSSLSSTWNFPSDISSAHAYLQINQAMAHSFRSEYDKALGLLQQAVFLLGAREVLPQTVTLAVYVHLLNGGDGIANALKLLKYNSPVLPTNGKLPNTHFATRSSSAGGSTSSSVSTTGDSSTSSTTSSAPRSKSSTPQPSAGTITPERVVKSKTSEKKRNRR